MVITRGKKAGRDDCSPRLRGKIGRITGQTISGLNLIVLPTFSMVSVVFSVVVFSVFVVVISLFGYEVSTAKARSLNSVNSVFALAEFTQLFQLVPSEPRR